MLAQFCFGTPTPQIQMEAIRRPNCRVLALTKRDYTKSPRVMLSITRPQLSVTLYSLPVDKPWGMMTNKNKFSCIRGSAKPLRGWTTSRSTAVFVVFSFIVSLQSFSLLCCECLTGFLRFYITSVQPSLNIEGRFYMYSVNRRCVPSLPGVYSQS